ncbi:MAG TPA: AAA family ATPase [Thermoleophilaceae bacterium]|nr:AAA family ATPase [Thermoleophilaceae bacterium]
MGSLETVAVVFTDLVGSTALSSQLGPVAADELRREHFAVLRAAIDASDGREVKNLGDGLMVVFPSASTAVACAVEMQQRIDQRNRSAERQLGVRIGVSLGEADCEDGDYFGTPVIEAARLCAKAQGGQILAVELVRMMSGGRGEVSFDDLGPIELKGLPEPVRTFEVAWQPLGGDADALPLPGRLRGVPPVAYVGRTSERDRLAALRERAVAGERRVALLSGEPGIGKTRLSTHTALEAHADGATVLLGRCQEDLGVPYGPWVEALSHYVEHAPAAVLEAHVERYGGELRRLVPALASRVPEAPAPRETDLETERYMLYGAVAGLLEEASRDRPIVLILDDLHWADKPSLALLKHTIVSGAELRVLTLGTYRDSDLTRGHPLSDLLADLRREEGIERIALGGLEQPDVVVLMEASAGHELDEAGRALAHEILRETDGNPFFVSEMLRHLVESGALYQREDGRWVLRESLSDLGLPQSVREVIGRRVERLGDEVTRTLSVAAVIGREFDAELLVRVVDVGEDALLDLLEEAAGSSVVSESPDQPGRFAFAHALFTHTLYDGLGPTRRARLHLKIAEALEELCGADPGPRLAELAHHWTLATTSVDTERALDYSRRAGERALAELAPDEALRWFTQALELLAQRAEPDRGLRCDLLIGLGDAQRQAGEGAFRETILEACSIARELGDADRLSRAALNSNRGQVSSFGDVDDERIDALRAALDLVGDGMPDRRARLLSLLAVEITWGASLEERDALGSEALALAEQLGDERVLGHVLHERCLATWFAGTLDRHASDARRLAEIADRVGDPVLGFWAGYHRFITASESGDTAEIERGLADMESQARRTNRPSLLWTAMWTRGSYACLTGRLAEAEATAEEAVALGTDSGEPDALMVYVAQLAYIRVVQGRLEEIEELIVQTAEDKPAIPAFQAAMALVYVEGDTRLDEARPLLQRFTADEFESVPKDQAWTTAVAYFGEIATRVGDATAAKAVCARLAPYEDLIGSNGLGSSGSLSLYLARAAGTAGRHDDAERWFAKSVEVNERMGARVYLARTLYGWAEALIARDADPDRAREMLERAAAIAREHELPELERQTGELLAARVQPAG